MPKKTVKTQEVPAAEKSGRIGKGELTQVVIEQMAAGGTKVSVHEGTKIVESVIDGIKSLLKAKGRVNIPGFGTFVIVNSEPRTAKNPQTGAPVSIGAKRRPKFRTSIKMMDEFNA